MSKRWSDGPQDTVEALGTVLTGHCLAGSLTISELTMFISVTVRSQRTVAKWHIPVRLPSQDKGCQVLKGEQSIGLQQGRRGLGAEAVLVVSLSLYNKALEVFALGSVLEALIHYRPDDLWQRDNIHLPTLEVQNRRLGESGGCPGPTLPQDLKTSHRTHP